MGRDYVYQLLYATALLTTISVAPLVTLQTHLVDKELPTARFLYPDVVSTAFVSLGLTAMAISPYMMIPTHWLTKHPRKFFLAMLPWILVCCIQFCLNVEVQLTAISHVSSGTNPKSLIFALIAYCGIFSLALEQMLHWSVIYNLMTEDFITTVSSVRMPWRTTELF
ncbi:hypothetical protein KR084_009085 [Drosophila pseudotakahashii]|nr:hypothetical protein KR084_009085 [Drosophila pseudotakahashii]